MTASTTEVNTEELEVVKGTVTLVMDKCRPGNCFSGVSCLFMKNIFLFGLILELSHTLEPVRQPQHPEMGDWGTELGAACLLVASDTLWGVSFDTAQWL